MDDQNTSRLPPPNLDLLRAIAEKGMRRYEIDAPRKSREVQDAHVLLHHGYVKLWGRAEQILPDEEKDHIEASITDKGTEQLAKEATHAALYVSWTESEAGWGCRPDGISLHETQEDAKVFIKKYWDAEKKRNPSGVTPSEYSRPDSSNGRLVLVSESLLKRVKASENGIRLWQTEVRSARSSGQIKFENQV